MQTGHVDNEIFEYIYKTNPDAALHCIDASILLLLDSIHVM